MKVRLSVEIKDLFGKPIPRTGEPGNMTLKDVIVHSLLLEDGSDGNTKFERYQKSLYFHAIKEPEVDMPVEEVGKIKELIGKSWAPIIVGRAWDILDPKE